MNNEGDAGTFWDFKASQNLVLELDNQSRMFISGYCYDNLRTTLSLILS